MLQPSSRSHSRNNSGTVVQKYTNVVRRHSRTVALAAGLLAIWMITSMLRLSSTPTIDPTHFHSSFMTQPPSSLSYVNREEPTRHILMEREETTASRIPSNNAASSAGSSDSSHRPLSVVLHQVYSQQQARILELEAQLEVQQREKESLQILIQEKSSRSSRQQRQMRQPRQEEDEEPEVLLSSSTAPNVNLLPPQISTLESSSSPNPRNPFHLPSYLSPTCQSRDTILLQRWITARQHTYNRVPHVDAWNARNPDPDPFCESTNLLIDTKPIYYTWSQKEVVEELNEEAKRKNKESGVWNKEHVHEENIAFTEQHSPHATITPLLTPSSSSRIIRHSGFSFPAQIHIISSRMLWAWQNGYTYVNIARTQWSKGIPSRAAWGTQLENENVNGKSEGEEELFLKIAEQIPYRDDEHYYNSSSASLLSSAESTCQTSGWDCFFLPHTSAGCLSRARRLFQEMIQYPSILDGSSEKIKQLERREKVLFNPDLNEWMKRGSVTNVERRREVEEVREGNHAAQQGFSPLATSSEFDLSVDATASDWLTHSANPWFLPGLSLTDPSLPSSSSSSSSPRSLTDLFLYSEITRFLLRPNTFMMHHTSQLMNGMNMTLRSMKKNEEEEEGEKQMMAISLHTVEESAGVSPPSSPSRTSSYLTLARKAIISSTPNNAISRVFLSIYPPSQSRLTRMKHELGVGSPAERGEGMKVFYLEEQKGSETSLEQRGGKIGEIQRAASTSAASSITSSTSSSVTVTIQDKEGAHHLASLYIMSVLSSTVIGQIATHWGRLVMELQQWSMDQCQPELEDWILPASILDMHYSPEEEIANTESSFPPQAAQKRFLDLDGGEYFLGDRRQ